jgi:hypothetical protein
MALGDINRLAEVGRLDQVKPLGHPRIQPVTKASAMTDTVIAARQ